MRLVRWGPPGRERPGVELPDGTRLDVSGEVTDFDGAFFAGGGIERLRARVDAEAFPRVDPDARLGPPVARPHKFIAIGLNYRRHAEEAGLAVPAEPEVFAKFTSCIAGPCDPVTRPAGCTRLDYEVELAFVVRDRLANLDAEADALSHVAGYLVCNDVSERACQFERGSQWLKGKCFDGFGPLGPWLVTPEEVGDPHRLALSTRVNGTLRQSGNTDDLIFGIPWLIRMLSGYLTLEPGDVITTGTPWGVAMGMNDPDAYLKPGDVVELEVEKLGVQRQSIRG